MISIDCHVHIGKDDRMGYELTPEELQQVMKLHEVDRAVIFPCPWDYSKPTYAYKNEAVVKAASQLSNVLPALLVDPSSLDSIKIVVELIESFGGIKALKFYPPAQDYEPQSIIDSKVWKMAITVIVNGTLNN